MNTIYDKTYPPEYLVNLATGNLTSSIFITALKMDVFRKLKSKSVTIELFSKILNLPITSTRCFVQILTNMQLLTYKKHRISNTILADTYLCNDTITKLLMKWLYDSIATTFDIQNALTKPPKQPWYEIRDKKILPFQNKFSSSIDSEFYSDSHELRIRWGEEIANVYSFKKHKKLLDVGAASGGWTVGILKHCPKLKAIIFDIPQVIPLTKEILKSHNDPINNLEFISGSFFKDMPKTNCDVVLLANVLHDWSILDCKEILKHIKNSVQNNATLLIKEFFFNDDWTNSYYAALQAYLVLGPPNKSGWQPSFEEMENLLHSAGYKHCRILKKNALIIAKA